MPGNGNQEPQITARSGSGRRQGSGQHDVLGNRLSSDKMQMVFSRKQGELLPYSADHLTLL